MDECRSEGCERPVHVQKRGLCKSCFEKARRRGEIPGRATYDACTIDGCDRTDVVARGMCEKHYSRFKRMGRAEPLTMLERFSKYVGGPDDNGCWPWTGTKATGGYGFFKVGQDSVRAHRVSWELHRGPIPEGLTIDHLCRVKHCVNPDHLEPVTLAENILRSNNMAAKWARRTECHICGGELFTRTDVRYCKVCEKRRRDKSRAKKLAA